MTNKVKIEGYTDLYKDKYSGAIVNCNLSEYMLAKKKKEDLQKMEKVQQEIKELKNTNEQILNLLQTLLERSKT